MTRYRFFAACLMAISLATQALAGFEDVEIKTNIKGDYLLGVLVSDQRETVAKWGAAENLIGAHHSGIFRNRKELLTESHNSLTKEMLDGLQKQFSAKWISVAPLQTTPGESRETIDEKVRKIHAHRTFLLTVKSLWIEAQHNNQTAITYNIVISILDENAVEIARKNMEGIQGSGQWGYWGGTEVLGMLISNALEDAKISAALSNK